jgi:hypothetical protein
MSLKLDVHDRLWQTFQRWMDLRQTGITKREIKLRGLRECRDPNRYTRNLIFSGNTLRTYERVLRDFVEFARIEHGATRLEDIGKKEFRAYMDRAINQGLAFKTLNLYRSALAKFGSAVTGQTQSFAALSEKYGWKIRKLAKLGRLATPTRATPSREVLVRAIAFLKAWDARHFDRTGEERVYHLVARLQLETAARSVSVTERMTASCLRDSNQVALIGKSGKVMHLILPPDLHHVLRLWFAHHSGPLATKSGYRGAYRRAIQAAGGRVTGTHGARRRSARDFYVQQYRQAVGSGLSPADAADHAAGDAIQRLGHSRDRRDHRHWYLDRQLPKRVMADERALRGADGGVPGLSGGPGGDGGEVPR